MKIHELLKSTRPGFSFEFFPPKNDEGMVQLLQTASALRSLDPLFVSVTYGAGGSTRSLTIDVVKAMKRDLGLEAMAHLTCIASSADDIRARLDEIAASGIENVLALRGDKPRDASGEWVSPDGLFYGSDLVKLIATESSLCVGGACYPEVHPEAPSLAADLGNLCLKVNAGAKFLITQLFFDNECYFRFVEQARRAGIDVPIIPGIMPITDFQQLARFTKMCGASIPQRLLAALEARKDEPEAVMDLGVAYATLQCVDLLTRGAPAIHFYTLNKSPASRAVVSALLAARPWDRPGGRHYMDGTDAIVESSFGATERR